MKCAIFEEHSSSCVVYSRFSGALFPVSMIEGELRKSKKNNARLVKHLSPFRNEFNEFNSTKARMLFIVLTLRAIVGNTSRIKIFLILCKRFVLYMDCRFIK